MEKRWTPGQTCPEPESPGCSEEDSCRTQAVFSAHPSSVAAGGSQVLSQGCLGQHIRGTLTSVPLRGPWVPEGWWVWEVWDPLRGLGKLCW